MAGVILPSELRNQIISNAPHIEESTGSFTTDIHGKLKSCEIDIVPYQNLHGFDKPWPAGVVENQLKPNVSYPDTINGVTITMDGGVFVLNGKATAAFDLPFDNWDSDYITFNGIDAFTNYTFTMSGENVGSLVPPVGKCGLFRDGKAPKGMDVTFFNGTSIMGMTSSTSTYHTKFYLQVPDGYLFKNTRIKVGFYFNTTVPSTWKPYENRCPATGYDKIKIQNDSKYPGEIEWNQMCDFSENGNWKDSFSAITHSWDNGKLTVYSPGLIAHHGCYFTVSGKTNHKYLYFVRGKSVPGSEHPFSGAFRIDKSGDDVQHYLPLNEEAEFSGIFTETRDETMYVIFSPSQDDYIVASCCMLFDLTQMFGAGKEPTLEQFWSMFRQEYYAYNPGVITTVDQVNGGTAKVWSVQFNDTVYAGKFDFITGDLTATWKAITLGTGWARQGGAYSNIGLFYNSQMYDDCKVNFDAMLPTYPFYKNTGIGNIENYSATSLGGMSRSLWIRNDDYENAADFEASISGDVLVYELNTPVVIHLTPQQMTTLKGSNNFFSDVGNMTIKYWTH